MPQRITSLLHIPDLAPSLTACTILHVQISRSRRSKKTRQPERSRWQKCFSVRRVQTGQLQLTEQGRKQAGGGPVLSFPFLLPPCTAFTTLQTRPTRSAPRGVPVERYGGPRAWSVLSLLLAGTWAQSSRRPLVRQCLSLAQHVSHGLGARCLSLLPLSMFVAGVTSKDLARRLLDARPPTT